jgi:hypothetical protein
MANTYTLFDIVYKCVIELGTARSGTATGGSTTTAIDTSGLKLVDEDYYNEGTFFALKDASVDVADIGKTFAEITAFSADSKTLTFKSALADAVASGDSYAVANRRFPLFLLRQFVNNNLYLEGNIPTEDLTLTSVQDQLEYDLPSEIIAQDMRQVWVAQTATEDKKDYRLVYNWSIKWNATGTASIINLENGLPGGYEIRLVYAQPHTELRVATDALHSSVHADRVIYPVCVDALRWYRNKTRLTHLDAQIDFLERKAQVAKDRHPLPPLPTRQSKVGVISRTLKMRGT